MDSPLTPETDRLYLASSFLCSSNHVFTAQASVALLWKARIDSTSTDPALVTGKRAQLQVSNPPTAAATSTPPLHTVHTELYLNLMLEKPRKSSCS